MFFMNSLWSPIRLRQCAAVYAIPVKLNICHQIIRPNLQPNKMQLRQEVLASVSRHYCTPLWLKIVPPSPNNASIMKQPTSAAQNQLMPVVEVDKYSLAILEGLHLSETMSDIFQAFREVGSDMNEIHVARAVCQLAEMKRDEDIRRAAQADSSESEPYQRSLVLKNKTDLEIVCKLVLRFSLYMDDQLFVDTLKSLHDIGVPVRSSVMQTLLLQSKERFNNFDPTQMSSFVQSLCKMQREVDWSDDLITALLDSCSILVVKILDQADDTEQITSLLLNLNRRLTLQTKQLMINKLHAIVLVKNNLNPKTSLIILRALSNLKFTKHPLQYKVLDFFLDNFDDLDGTNIINLLFEFKKSKCLNMRTLTLIASKAVDNSEMFSMKNLIELTGILSAHRFVDVAFLTCIEKRSAVEHIDFRDLQKLGSIFAALNLNLYIDLSDFCSRLSKQAIIVLAENHHDGSDCKMLISASASLAQLGRANDVLTAFAIGEDCQELISVLEGENFDAHISQNFQTLSMLTGSPYPSSRPQCPPVSASPGQCPVKETVKEVLMDMYPEHSLAYDVSCGDVQMNLDFVIINGHPVNDKICLLMAPTAFYVANGNQLLGKPAVLQKYLSNLGYMVIWIPIHKIEMRRSSLSRKKYLTQMLSNLLG